MKKIISLLILVCICFSLASCGNTAQSVICVKCYDNNLDGKCDRCDKAFEPPKDNTDVMGTGECVYAKIRDISGRDIKYVEICFEGFGRCVVLLDATTAPITVANFISLVEQGFYDGLTMHRIIRNFMIQGGDPEANGQGGSPNKIKGEFASNGHQNDILHLKGVISMARGVYSYNSASSQFFICNAVKEYLDGDYAAFGYVVEGLSVIDDITDAVAPKAIDGDGTIKYEDQPVIKYIKVLEDY